MGCGQSHEVDEQNRPTEAVNTIVCRKSKYCNYNIKGIILSNLKFKIDWSHILSVPTTSSIKITHGSRLSSDVPEDTTV